MNLSFAGCGFLGIYHVGVAVCFRKYAPHLLLDKISGASAGAIAACCLICDLPIGDITSDVLRVATQARSKSLGPFNPKFNIQTILFDGLAQVLPEDAHIKCSGKLHVSLTRVRDGKNVIISEFSSREELMQVLQCSSWIPLFSGILPPMVNGVRYMDGGFSDNLPTLDENTITVSPFCGESDICPRDDSSQLFHINVANTSIEISRHNIYRIARILYPPKPEILSNMCKQGFDDALRFLHRNNLINCTRCLAVQSTFVVSEKVEENSDYDPECHECNLHRQEALVSNMPDTVVTIFQEAIDSANKGIVNWLFRHRGMKLLSVLSLPYTLPVDMVHATFTKFNVFQKLASTPKVIYNTLTNNHFTSMIGTTIERRSFDYKIIGNAVMSSNNITPHITHKHKRLLAAAPTIGSSFWDVSKYLMNQVSTVISNVNTRRQQLSSKITCHLDITEYGRSNFKSEANKEVELSTTNKMNLNFTLNLDDNEMPINQTNNKFRMNKILSRQSSVTLEKPFIEDEDTFEHILQVTAHHEAIMAYYYLDENNKVKVTEIFDVTDSDSPAVQSADERELNHQLEFDEDEFGEASYLQSINDNDQLCIEDRSMGTTDISDYDDIFDKISPNMFSDPESEWNGNFHLNNHHNNNNNNNTQNLDDDSDDDVDDDDNLRPESEQSSIISQLTKPIQIPRFTY